MDPLGAKEKKWYQMTHEEALKNLGSTPEGLPSSEAARRLEKYGPNTLGDEKGSNIAKVFVHQFKNPLIYILLSAAAAKDLKSFLPTRSFAASDMAPTSSFVGRCQQCRMFRTGRALPVKIV